MLNPISFLQLSQSSQCDRAGLSKGCSHADLPLALVDLLYVQGGHHQREPLRHAHGATARPSLHSPRFARMASSWRG